ncbi:hypothetical protein [Gordonia sp. JH63]|uniref:Eco57I restriction-modification methylase domain-containing protein n=1 Tax=Gordonia sp. JH63 TaxID=2698900 RepID=UPI001EF1408B|nr:hypothetical protein [Gordonia sp. JH63]
MRLSAHKTVKWTVAPAPDGVAPEKVYFGPDPHHLGGFQVAVARAASAPSRQVLREIFNARKGKTQVQLIIAILHDETAHLFGPDPQAQAVELPIEQAQRQLQSVLAEPDVLAATERYAAFRKANDTTGVVGFTNSGLFATHHITSNVPKRSDWEALGKSAEPLLSKRGRQLVEALGFGTAPGPNGTILLSTGGHPPRAVAVLLDDSEHFDTKTQRFQLSPVAFGLAVASRQGVPWLLVLRKDQIRLYPGRDGVGVGSKGQADTFFEIDLSTIGSELAALLPLVFSANALVVEGTADELLRDSARYATELGARLRERIYGEIVPPLAVEVAHRLAKNAGVKLDADGLALAYRVTLHILFRLIFQAYAEDRGLLPSGRNEAFDANSLKTNARRLLDADTSDFGDSSTIWFDLVQVWNAIDHGNPQWQIPSYNGGLFSINPDRSPEGALIAKIELPDTVLGPALKSLLVDINEDGILGIVDFRSLSVREFGTIYEGLLESSLSLAGEDLTVDKNGTWVPAKKSDDLWARKGEVYFHTASGERKATGSYFTPKVVVDHLIERSIVPALDQHLQRIGDHLLGGDSAAAAREFFDFRVADLAMGSGHFLVAAVDKIESLMRTFLTEHSVPGVTEELHRLKTIARDELGTDDVAKSEVDEVGLLRRQVARRCVYGLDVNPMAVELARLALWIHTFVPGLPMSNLDHGLVNANSLTGIGSIDEAVDALVGVSNSFDSTYPGSPGLGDGLFEPADSLFADRTPRIAKRGGYQEWLRDVLTNYLDSAKPLLVDMANASEANKSEVEKAGELLARAREAAEPARRIFDAAIAVRLGKWSTSITRPEHVSRLTEASEPGQVVRSLHPAHMPYLFPEVFLRERSGFDVILGNPPWDKVRHEPTSFWAVRDPGLNALPDVQRKQRIEYLREARPVEAAEERAEASAREELQEYFKKAFSWRGGTHLELAQLFLERALRSVSMVGEVALVLPRQFSVLGGWKNLRKKLFDRHDVLIVQGRNRGEWLFEGVDARYAVVLLNASPHRGLPICVGVVGSEVGLRLVGGDTVLMFTRDELASMSDSNAIPWFNNPGDRQVFDKMRDYPRISNPGSWVQGVHDARWDFRGTGPDRALATRTDEPGAWKVMMTRHADAYELRPAPVKQFITDFMGLASKGRGIDVEPSGPPVIGAEHPLVLFRHPSRSDDTRTLIGTALPDEGWIYNKGYVHAFAHSPGTSVDARLAVLGLLNSVIEDWWARRFVDRHVTAPVINNLPLPNLSPDDVTAIADRVASLLARSGYVRLAGGIEVEARANRSPFGKATTASLIAGIDALVARGYGLTTADFAIIREDFSPNGYPDDVFSLACIDIAR